MFRLRMTPGGGPEFLKTRRRQTHERDTESFFHAGHDESTLNPRHRLISKIKCGRRRNRRRGECGRAIVAMAAAGPAGPTEWEL
jgi:hypothetical protein